MNRTPYESKQWAATQPAPPYTGGTSENTPPWDKLPSRVELLQTHQGGKHNENKWWLWKCIGKVFPYEVGRRIARPLRLSPLPRKSAIIRIGSKIAGGVCYHDCCICYETLVASMVCLGNCPHRIHLPRYTALQVRTGADLRCLASLSLIHI